MQCYDAVAQRAAASSGGRTVPVGYEDVGEAAFGAFGRAIVSASIYTELLGTAALLFILEVCAFVKEEFAPFGAVGEQLSAYRSRREGELHANSRFLVTHTWQT